MEYTSVEVEIDTNQIVFADPAVFEAQKSQLQALEDEIQRRGLEYKVFPSFERPGVQIVTIWGPKKALAELSYTPTKEKPCS